MMRNKESEYRDGMLEGGEGYNPFGIAREEAGLENVETRGDRKSRLIRKSNIADLTTAEGLAVYESAQAELAAIQAEENAEFEAEWTLDTTKARRIEWNAYAATIKGRPDPREFEAKMVEIGYTLSNLRKAIKLHSL